MDINVYDNTPEVRRMFVVDVKESFIWTERYTEAGDFELLLPYSDHYKDEVFVENYYITMPRSERRMIIESSRSIASIDEGEKLLVKGRSLESILDRRVVVKQVLIDSATGTFNKIHTLFYELIDKAIINPADTDREISNFFQIVSTDPDITSIDVEGQYWGDNLYDIISTVCTENDVGFKIVWEETNLEFVFSLYIGEDRSYGQYVNPFVIFSPELDNLLTSEFFETIEFNKTWSLVKGDVVNDVYGTVGVFTPLDSYAPNRRGLERKEMFTDASNLSHMEEGTTNEIPVAKYNKMLENRGKKQLIRNRTRREFMVEVDPDLQYTYGVDFFLGDIVQFVDFFGHRRKARITEVTFSEGVEGFRIFPTFELV